MGRGGGNGDETLSWTILQADARQIPLKDKSVQCVVTSPPYWGLRDYGTATWVGGDEGCQHRSGNQVKQTRAPYECETGQRPGIDASKCSLCGATRIDSQIGLEPTPEAYVAKIVAVFKEIWRVLRDDGTVFCNLGDSYSNAGTRQGDRDGWVCEEVNEHRRFYRPTAPGLKNKDLVGIPWRVAFALQAAGWYLRSDIIWSKPNPMPESVTDRPTKAHEYIFLLTKRERYYFDQDAVREQAQPDARRFNGGHSGNNDRNDNGNQKSEAITNRNIRTVWEIATQPYPEAHFATFPEEIAVRCIKAGSKVGSIVLDPFSGAGTVPLVADKLNRHGIGLELKSEYCRMASRRCYDDAPLLSSAIIIV